MPDVISLQLTAKQNKSLKCEWIYISCKQLSNVLSQSVHQQFLCKYDRQKLGMTATLMQTTVMIIMTPQMFLNFPMLL